jgi:hypothetical protein
VKLIGQKQGLPDFVYQRKVVSDEEKEKVRSIIKEIKKKVLEISIRIEPGKNNVIIPFNEILTSALPHDCAADMTTSNRLYTFLKILPLINTNSRPALHVFSRKELISRTFPFALFEDLRETLY